MVKGIVVIRWDDKVGTVLEGKYPDNLHLTDEHVMRIFTTHALGDANPGFLSMRIEDLNVASYYSGELPGGKGQFCISLILDLEEDSEIFEEILAEVASDIISEFGKTDFQNILISGFDLVTKSTELEEEQRYALIFSDTIRISILNRLTESSITRKELIDWVKENRGTEMTDLNAVLAPFIKSGIIRLSFVEGITDECIFLVKDIYGLRSPEMNTIKKVKDKDFQKDISKKYMDIVTEFFNSYKPDQEDVSRLAVIFTDPNNYSLIKLLMETPLKMDKFLNKSSLASKNPKTIIDNLVKNKVIAIIKDDSDNEWLFLLSTLKFIIFFPEYLIDKIRQDWNSGLIDQKQALRHLDLLKEIYYY